MDGIRDFAQTIMQAASLGIGIQIKGGDTKSFLGYVPEGLQILSTASHTGVLDYHPAELVIRAKAGTAVNTLKELLAGEGQMLAFEPPMHGLASTIGGVVSAGMSGSARPYRGAARDQVLGVGMLLHDGNYCEFGGQVMKNVAGYDVSRLVCGAYGTLGMIADLSLRVVPLPECTITVTQNCSIVDARDTIRSLSNQVSPISASAYADNTLRIRLSGSEQAVNAAKHDLGGDVCEDAFWAQLDNGTLPLFKQASDVWRLSTEPDEPIFDYDFAMIDWGFAQRWLLDPATVPRDVYHGSGHWTRIRRDETRFPADVFQPLPRLERRIHQRLKSAFDPNGIFNPHRMYREEGL